MLKHFVKCYIKGEGKNRQKDIDKYFCLYDKVIVT